MPSRRELNFTSGDLVVEGGDFLCTAGEKKNLKKGEKFPLCPVQGQETVWRRLEK